MEGRKAHTPSFHPGQHLEGSSSSSSNLLPRKKLAKYSDRSCSLRTGLWRARGFLFSPSSSSSPARLARILPPRSPFVAASGRKIALFVRVREREERQILKTCDLISNLGLRFGKMKRAIAENGGRSCYVRPLPSLMASLARSLASCKAFIWLRAKGGGQLIRISPAGADF